MLCWFKPLTAECYPDTLGSEKRVEQAAVKTVLRIESRKDCEQVQAENPRGVQEMHCTTALWKRVAVCWPRESPWGGAGTGWEE